MNKTRLDITGHASTSKSPPGAVSLARVCHFFYDGGTYIATHTLCRAFFLSLTGMQACSHTGAHMSQQKVLRIACACASTYAHAQPRIHTRSHARAHAHTHACSHTPTPPYIHRNRQRHVHTHRRALKRTCPDQFSIRLHARYTHF